MNELRLLKFEADWCGPCSQQAAILEDYDATPVEAVDIDEEQETAREYDVRGIPTLVLESEGQEVTRFSGVTQLDEIEAAVADAESE